MCPKNYYTKFTDEEAARIVDDPLMSMPDKLDLLHVKDVNELRELRSNLPVSLPAAGNLADTAPATVQTWNPPRSFGYLAQRQALYPSLTDTPKKRFQMCYDYGGSKGLSFVQTGIELQAGFACTGFSHDVKKNERAKGYYDSFADLFNMRDQLFQIFKSLIMYNNAVVIWRKPPKNKYGRVFNEFRVEPVKNLTVDYIGATNDITDDGNMVYLDIDIDHKTLIEKLERGNSQEKKIAADFAKQFPKLYGIYKTRRADTKYLLDNRDGEFWAIINFENRGAGLDDPSMESIFPDCEIWKSLQQADLVVAGLVKQMVVLVTQGETLSLNDTSMAWKAPTDIPNPGWPRTADLGRLKTAFAQRLGSLIYIFGPHHTKVDFKHPSPEVMGKAKYEQALANILAWLSIASQFIIGEGGQFQAGELNKITLTSKLDTMREVGTTELRNRVYAHPTININGYTEIPAIAFDRDVLKSPRDVRDDLKMDSQLGVSQTQLLRRRGYDIEREMELREQEREKYGDALANVVDFSGNAQPAGRPEGDNPPGQGPRRDEEL